MPRAWARTWPKTTSHSTGCTARENSSVGSRMSFLSSTSATAALSPKNLSTGPSSAQPLGGPAGPDGVAEIPALADAAARPAREDVVHARALAHAGPQLRWPPDDGDAPRVQDRKLVAERLGFLHVVCRDQDRHAVVPAQIP